jgi:hypothetical protein|tara:strand:+ start:119 stop:493 length:375 start_codon:yes stop_codon:yes gene_type:complete
MESLEAIKDGKLYWEDGFRTYGEHLLAELEKLHSDVPMVGRFRAPIPFEHTYEELYFTIKRGRSNLAKFNPLAKKLVRVYEHYQSGPWMPKTVTVFDSSLREDVTRIVSELNEKSGKHFDVKYA